MNSWLSTKEQEVTYRPTLLFQIKFQSGAQMAVTTAFNGHAPNMDDVGVIFQGSFYNAVVTNQQMGAMQSYSGLGVDAYGSMSIELADANGRWYGYQNAFGFAGATMRTIFAFYDPLTDTFSPDWKVIFEGSCDPASYQDNRLTIRAVSDYSMSTQVLPILPIQRLCPKDYPSTQEERQAAANDPLSPFYQCGYSPDIPGGNAAGNYGPNGPYTSCNRSKADCQARGLFRQDNAGRVTRRFGASQYVPPATWKGNSYTQGKSLQGVNTENLKKYTQFAPLTYGTTWTPGIPMNGAGDPNSTRAEVVLGSFWYDFNRDWPSNIPAVVVNGLLTPYATKTSDLLFRWYDACEGARSGFLNQGPPFSSNSDPLASMLTIIPIVYQEVASSAQPLDVKALVHTRPIPVFTADGGWSYQRNDTIAWTLYDIFRLIAPKLCKRINLQSVINYEYICGSGIQYRRIDGSSSFRGRYRVSLAITEKVSASQVIEGLKLSGRLLVVPSADGSELIFLCRQSAADQQPTPYPGSNDNSPYASYSRYDSPDGSPSGIGYSAYSFDESNVLTGSVRFDPAPVNNAPTMITCNIQDEDNQWTPDQVTVGCPNGYDRIQRNNQVPLQIIGCPNYDQGRVAAEVMFAETWQGNRRNDFGGTEKIIFDTSFRGLHLTLGALIRFRWAKLGIPDSWWRVQSISPTRDCQKLTITATFHNDKWYCDSFVPRV